MPDTLYCDQTTPWQGVYFFTNTVCREIDTVYIFLLYCVVTTHFTLDSKLLLQKSALGCSKVSLGSEKRLHQIDGPIRMQYFFQNISNSNLNWYKDMNQPFSD